jgi:Tol biopolymer transport system component
MGGNNLMKKRTWRLLFFGLLFTMILGSMTLIHGETTELGLIAFESTRAGNSTDPVNDDIYVMNPDGTGITRLTDSSDYDGVPCWSPDGSQIVFESWRDTNRNREIYVMNSDGTNQINLTNNQAIDEAPAWSPDGTKIAFDSNRSGQFQIYIMNLDGSNVTQLTTNGGLEPAWSFDGSHIAYESNHEIYVMNVDGSEQTRLTNNSADDGWPAWSPDNTKITFVSDRDGNREIYIMNLDGTDQINLTRSSANDWYPSWSPSGSKIIFESIRDGNYELYEMNADGTRQTRLTQNDAFDEAPVWNWQGTITVPEKVIHPILEDVTDNGNGTYTAHFGYQNDYDTAITLPVGPYNNFNPTPEDRGQPITFQSGRVTDVFDVVFDGSDLVWTLNGEAAIAAWHPRNVWTTDTPLLDKRANFAAVEANGKIYVFGGTDAHLTRQYNSVQEYNPVTKLWTYKTNMPTARESLCAVYLNNKIYVIGGYNGAGYLKTVEVYDPNNDTWDTTIPSLNEKRGYAGVAVVKGKIYVIGGLSLDVPGYIKNTVEEYDPTLNQWTLKAPIPTKRWSLGAAVFNDKIYAIGGDTASSNWSHPSAIVEVYDPDANSWSPMPNISSTRAAFGITTLNQKIYIIGGVGGDNLTTEYDPATQICQDKAHISTPRILLGAVSLNGSIYAIGGRNSVSGNIYYNIVETMVP